VLQDKLIRKLIIFPPIA